MAAILDSPITGERDGVMGIETENYVELRNINKHFGSCKASDQINIGIKKGKLAALLGPSGSGKTTILRMIAGLENPDSGEIIIDGRIVNDVPGSERGIGFVFQNYALFRYMTVYENIAFGLRVNKGNKADRNKIDARVRELIRLIGFEGLENRYPNQLSGGQKQRVAFARALAPNPQLLLLDEPFAAIDAKVRQELRSWLRGMIDRLGITSIFVTHDQDEAIEVADEIIVTNEGRVEQAGTPMEIYKNPATPFMAQFIGNSTVIENYHGLRCFSSGDKGNKAVVRPEFISIAKKGEELKYRSSAEEGKVEGIAFRGNSLEVRVRLHDKVIIGNRGLDDALVSVGETVDVFIYRLYAMEGGQVTLLENEALKDESVVI